MSTPNELDLLEEYKATLAGKAPGTVDAYLRALRKLMDWISERPGSQGEFKAAQLTRTAVETYLTQLQAENYSPSHQTLVKAAISGFARWLIEEKEVLQRNPARGVEIPSQPLMAPRMLSEDQRYVLKNLVERSGDLRGEALFALGYWVGCRVSDVSWLKKENTHVTQRTGWLVVGHKGSKQRKIDLIKPARRALYEYIKHGGRDRASEYTFTSQRADRLSEAGIHHWLRNLKKQATWEEWEFIHDITYHDLRHDFAHRARESSWTLEEIAYYLGHITKKGTPALQTTVRYTQASRDQIKAKLSRLTG